jgi:hypothetical protein
MERKWLLIGAIVFVLFLSYLWNRNKNFETNDELPVVEEIITQEDGTIVKKTGDLIEEISPEEIEEKKQEIETQVFDIEATPLQAGEGQVGGGTTKAVFTDGTYYQKVEVSNLSSLEKGYYYQVWLQNEAEASMSIGRLEMIGDMGQLYYSAKDDRRSYNTVIVTKEMEDGDTSMGEIILQTQTE